MGISVQLDRLFPGGDSHEPSPANEPNIAWVPFRTWHAIDAWDVTLRLRGIVPAFTAPWLVACRTPLEAAAVGAVTALTCLPGRSVVRYVRVRLH